MLLASLASGDRKEWLSVFDGRVVGGCYRNQPTRPHAVNRRSNSQRFDIAQLTIAVEELSLGGRGTAQVKDSDEVRFDRIDAQRRRFGRWSVG